MKAAILTAPGNIAQKPLHIQDVPRPALQPGHVLLKVRACGVCRTDLHIVEGELPPRLDHVIPGHQIVGEVVDGATPNSRSARASASPGSAASTALARTARGEENLCDAPDLHRLHRERRLRRVCRRRAPTSSFRCRPSSTICTPRRCSAPASSDSAACASRACSTASASDCSASAPRRILRSGAARLEVRGLRLHARRIASQAGRVARRRMGGREVEKPPVRTGSRHNLRAQRRRRGRGASSLRKGGVVAINAIHLDRIPQFDYDTLLWGERQIRSVANMTRADARDFLKIAAEIELQPKVTSSRSIRRTKRCSRSRKTRSTAPP